MTDAEWIVILLVTCWGWFVSLAWCATIAWRAGIMLQEAREEILRLESLR